MKHILISLAALSLLAACNKQTSGEQVAPEKETALVTFLLADAELSRATSCAPESTIEQAQVAAYNSSGVLLAVASAVNGAAVLRVPVGEGGCTAFALANSSFSLENCATLNAALSASSTLGANRASSLSGLEMAGILNGITFTPDYSGTIMLRRFAAKVEIDEIANAIPGNPTLSIKGIYLINVNTLMRHDFGGSTLNWAQKRAYTASETTVTPCTADIFTTTVNGASSYGVPHYFYCYPNPTTTDSSSETWSPRYTRLVVEASYSGHDYYYPINIKGADGRLNFNTSYIISKLTITGPGSDSPDKPITKGGASFSLSVMDWTSGISQEVEI